MLIQTSRWYQNRSSVLVWDPCTKTQLFFVVNRKFESTQNGHPVVIKNIMSLLVTLIAYVEYLNFESYRRQRSPPFDDIFTNMVLMPSSRNLFRFLPRSLSVLREGTTTLALSVRSLLSPGGQSIRAARKMAPWVMAAHYVHLKERRNWFGVLNKLSAWHH